MQLGNHLCSPSTHQWRRVTVRLDFKAPEYDTISTTRRGEATVNHKFYAKLRSDLDFDHQPSQTVQQDKQKDVSVVKCTMQRRQSSGRND